MKEKDNFYALKHTRQRTNIQTGVISNFPVILSSIFLGQKSKFSGSMISVAHGKRAGMGSLTFGGAGFCRIM